MAETTDDSTATTGGTPDDAAAQAAATGSKQGAQDDSTLASRYAGQTAKVNELTGQLTAAKSAEKEALQKLRDYESGKVGADEALKSQLEAAKAEATAARKEASLARVEAKYPETFAEFGELVAEWPAEKLAAAEARLQGSVVEDPPTPGSPNKNASSTTVAKPAKPKTADEVEAELLSMARPW